MQVCLCKYFWEFNKGGFKLITIKIVGQSHKLEDEQYVVVGFYDENQNLFYQHAYYDKDYKTEDEILDHIEGLRAKFEDSTKDKMSNGMQSFVNKYKNEENITRKKIEKGK